MRLKNSPLQLIESRLNKISVTTHIPKKLPDSISSLEYNVNLDFDIFEEKDNDLLFVIKIKLTINRGRKKLLGYVILVETDYIFKIYNSNYSAEEIDNFKGISAISMAIAKLREDISNITAPYHFGVYRLPSINIRQLLKDKRQDVLK